MLDVLTWQQGSPRVMGLKRTLSLGETWPIFHSSVDVMVQGHTKPPRLGPSNMSATGMSPACALAPQMPHRLSGQSLRAVTAQRYVMSHGMQLARHFPLYALCKHSWCVCSSKADQLAMDKGLRQSCSLSFTNFMFCICRLHQQQL